MGNFIDRTGEVNYNNQGEKMTIIAYRKAIDIDIQFEDGSVAYNKCYGNFKKGLIKHPIRYEESFAYHIKVELGIDLDNIWNWEKNNGLGINPYEIYKCSKKKVWLYCQEKDYHGSYKVKCNDFFNNCRCPYCKCHSSKIHPLDSLGYYIINNYGEDFLWKVWSNKNEKSPFEIAPNSNKKYWWNCPDNKHESFYRKTQTSKICEFRCPKCVQEREESIIEEKVRLYLKELGYEVNTEYKCSIKPINPKSKLPLPFDNEIVLENDRHLIIEVHGVQHYKIDGIYTKTKKELEYQQYKDKYKKDYCIKMDYEYLEISYTTFDKNDTYKKLINNKIKEILEG